MRVMLLPFEVQHGISNVPAARLFDEFLKLFQSGHAEKTFDLLRRYGLFARMFPETDAALNDTPPFEKFVRRALVNTDERVNADQSVTPMFLIGVFLWEPIRLLAERLLGEEKMSDSHAISLAAYEVSGLQQSRISLPRRFTAPMREMLALQPRFDNTSGRRAMNLLEHRRFRAAYDFMMLRADAGAVDPAVAGFWTEVQNMNAEQRQQHFNVSGKSPGTRKRRPRRRSSRKKQQ
jgi:poly(A) polymerase